MKILSVICLFILLTACKKDKLKGEYAILEGRWKFVFAVERTYNTVTQYEAYDTIYASEFPDTYEFEYLKCGKVRKLKNEEELSEDRIVFDYLVPDEHCQINNAKRYRILLNNEDENTIGGCVAQDTLTSTREHLPTSLADDVSTNIQVSYSRRFVKVQ